MFLLTVTNILTTCVVTVIRRIVYHLVEGIKLNSDHWHDCQSKHIVVFHVSIKIMMFAPLTMILLNALHIEQTSSNNSLWKAGLLTQNASELKSAVTSMFQMFH